MFMTGELDDPSTHAEAARADLAKLGITTGLTVIPQAPHAFLGRQTSFDTCVEACHDFFRRHLKGR
jgi:dienelactone hydrolase